MRNRNNLWDVRVNAVAVNDKTVQRPAELIRLHLQLGMYLSSTPKSEEKSELRS